jgi:hypothetical protein
LVRFAIEVGGLAILACVARVLRQVLQEHNAFLERAYRAPDCILGCLVKAGQQALRRKRVPRVTSET